MAHDIRERAKRLEKTLHQLRTRGMSEGDRINAVESAIRDALAAERLQFVSMIRRLCLMVWDLMGPGGQFQKRAANDLTNEAYRLLNEEPPRKTPEA
jgi:uncharacterized protein YoaH (UPF0181 family)